MVPIPLPLSAILILVIGASNVSEASTALIIPVRSWFRAFRCCTCHFIKCIRLRLIWPALAFVRVGQTRDCGWPDADEPPETWWVFWMKTSNSIQILNDFGIQSTIVPSFLERSVLFVVQKHLLVTKRRMRSFSLVESPNWLPRSEPHSRAFSGKMFLRAPTTRHWSILNSSAMRTWRRGS